MNLAARFAVLRHAARCGIADYGAMYTVRTWVAGWLSRVLCQVAFFGSIGLLLGSPSATAYLVVGNSAMIVVVECCSVCASTSWERQSGTLPLLIASPAGPLAAFAGRSVFWLGSGTVTSTVSLFAVAPLFGVPLPWPGALAAIPLIVLIGCSTYCFALVLAGFVLRVMELRNVASNVASLSLMALCGVQVPAEFWPRPVQVITDFLPLKHGLAALRAVLAGDGSGRVWWPVLAEAGVAAGWLLVAALVFRRFVEGGRRSGSIEFGEA